MKYIVNVSYYKFEFSSADEAMTFAYDALTSCTEDVKVSVDLKPDEAEQPEEEDNF